MGKRTRPPLIRFSALGRRIYALTRYTVKDTHVLAHEKLDVTDEAVAAVQAWQRQRRPR